MLGTFVIIYLDKKYYARIIMHEEVKIKIPTMFYNFIRKVCSCWRTDIKNGYWKVPYNITNPLLRYRHTRIRNNIKNNDMITNVVLVEHHEYSSFLQQSCTYYRWRHTNIMLLIFLILFFAIILLWSFVILI